MSIQLVTESSHLRRGALSMKILVGQPSRMSGLTRAAVLSVAVHAVGSLVFWYYPLIATVIGLSKIQFVEESYDRTILIDFSRRLSYPPGYAGFRPPEKALSLEDVARLEKRRRAREDAGRRARERAEAKQNQQAADEAARQARIETGPNASAPTLAANPTAPTVPADGYPGGFGKINTAPIKDQVQTIYRAYKAGKIILPEGRLKVGVTGRIMADGTLADCKIILPSGEADIDRAALAILEAVSASRALGPLHEMTSLTMILNVGQQHAELSVVGFTGSEEAAANIVNLANAALLFARFKKADDPGAMVIINNLKVTRLGQRVQAVIAMPRQKASESLAQTVGDPKT